MKFHNPEWRLRLKFHQALELESASKDEEFNSHRRMGAEHFLTHGRGKETVSQVRSEAVSVLPPPLKTEVTVFHHLPKNFCHI